MAAARRWRGPRVDDHRYKYLQNLSTAAACRKYMDCIANSRREAWTAGPDRLGWGCPIYVADTDERAHREMKPHIENMYNTFFPDARTSLLPAGLHVARVPPPHRARQGADIRRADVREPDATRSDLVRQSRNRPSTTGRNAVDWGFDTHIGVFHFGTLPHGFNGEQLRLFATGVIPKLRQLNEPLVA